MPHTQVHKVGGLVQRLPWRRTNTGNEKRMSAQQQLFHEIDGRARMGVPCINQQIETVLLSTAVSSDSALIQGIRRRSLGLATVGYILFLSPSVTTIDYGKPPQLDAIVHR